MLDQLAPTPPRNPRYEVRLDVFSGPLPLLLHLIERRELDITLVSLAEVADQYIAHIQALPEPDPDHLADFLVVAAKLLVIKAMALVARPVEPVEEDEALDLVRALQEYRLFRAAAAQFKAWEAAERRAYPRTVPVAPIVLPTTDGLSLEVLISAVRGRPSPRPPEPLPALPAIIFTVADKISDIEHALARHPEIRFLDFLQPGASIIEVVVTFLALLEMLKRRTIAITQPTVYAPITISKPTEVALPRDTADSDGSAAVSTDVVGEPVSVSTG